jgi:hypothetical protein
MVDTAVFPIVLWGQMDLRNDLNCVDLAPVSISQMMAVFSINGLFRIGAFALNRVTFGATLSVCYDIAPEPAINVTLTTLATGHALCTYINQDHFVVLTILKNTTYQANISHGVANIVTVGPKLTLTGAIARRVSVSAFANDIVSCAILNDGDYISVFNLIIDDNSITIRDASERIVETGSNSSVNVCAVTDTSALLTYNNNVDNKLTAKYLTLN